MGGLCWGLMWDRWASYCLHHTAPNSTCLLCCSIAYDGLVYGIFHHLSCQFISTVSTFMHRLHCILKSQFCLGMSEWNNRGTVSVAQLELFEFSKYKGKILHWFLHYHTGYTEPSFMKRKGDSTQFKSTHILTSHRSNQCDWQVLQSVYINYSILCHFLPSMQMCLKA